MQRVRTVLLVMCVIAAACGPQGGYLPHLDAEAAADAALDGGEDAGATVDGGEDAGATVDGGAPDASMPEGGGGCVPESDPEFCARFGRNCGAVTSIDNCERARTVECGSCIAPQTCGGGGMANICGCTPETDAAFCARLGAVCGPLTGPDSCGTLRTVASCGSCPASEVCGGGGAPGRCGCAPESDAAFCARQGFVCGAASGADNCGTARSVASCGSCTLPQSCGGGGMANQCGCTPESDAAFCARYGAVCGALSRPDNCGRTRSLASCGTCSVGSFCGSSNQCVGYEVAHTGPSGATFRYIWGSGETDIWAAGPGVLRHWDGTSWATVSSPIGSRDPSGVWGRSASEVYLVAGPASSTDRTALIARWNGVSWTTTTLSNIYSIVGVHGNASRVYVVGRRYTTFSSVAALWESATGVSWNSTDYSNSDFFAGPVWTSPGNEDCWTVGVVLNSSGRVAYNFASAYTYPAGLWASNLWGAARNDVWAVGGSSAIGHWNGTRWEAWPGTESSWNLRAVHGNRASNVWAVGENRSVVRWDGTRWQAMEQPLDTVVPATASFNAVWVAPGGRVYIVGDNKVVRTTM